MACVSERYHTLIQLAPDPVFLIDAEQRTILETNDRAAALLDYQQSTLEGMDLAGLHPEERTDAYRLLFDRLASGESEEIRTDRLPDGTQLYLVTSEGRRVPVELHARTVALDGGTLIYAIARNITRQHRQQRELERQNERLEEFASIVSHDLRSPLTVAQGRLELAREDADSEHLSDIEHAHERMETLISDLLELARQGDTAVEQEPVALQDIVSSCWRIVETAEATVATETTQTVQADRSRLQQLIENLIRNAVEHGGNDVSITVGDLSDGFYVADDGAGIPPEQRADVFDTGYSTSEDGTGFGLSIVEEVADAHGWTVRATESADGGARFEITGVTVAE
jgi:PAS domain S-box-containing protein